MCVGRDSTCAPRGHVVGVTTPGGHVVGVTVHVVGGVVCPTESHEVYQKGVVLHLLLHSYYVSIVSVNTNLRCLSNAFLLYRTWY